MRGKLCNASTDEHCKLLTVYHNNIPAGEETCDGKGEEVDDSMLCQVMSCCKRGASVKNTGTLMQL